MTNSDGSSSLSLPSGTSGTDGSLTVDSAVPDTSNQTVSVPASSGDNTLAGLASAINSARIGVTANVVTNSTGSQLVLVSWTSGSSGALKVASSVTDTAMNTSVNYNNSGSDINSLTSLGFSVNRDGSISLDATYLDAALNSDYGSVVGFFQNANSWGQTFSTMLNNSGASSSTGTLSLASSSNSSIESTLSGDISPGGEHHLCPTEKPDGGVEQRQRGLAGAAVATEPGQRTLLRHHRL